MTVIYKKMTQTQMIVVGYLLLILLGSILLMLPVSSRDGNMTAYHFDPDPDRRYGIYDNWCLCGDSVKKKDRA